MTAADATPILHALLICRGVTSSENGDVSLENVVEILPTASLPADLGPLCFVAFVRDLPAGPGQGAFVVRQPGGKPLGRLPLEVTVPEGLAGRQLALHVKLPTFPVEAGGWFEVAFAWGETELGANRFAVGAKG